MALGGRTREMPGRPVHCDTAATPPAALRAAMNSAEGGSARRRDAGAAGPMGWSAASGAAEESSRGVGTSTK